MELVAMLALLLLVIVAVPAAVFVLVAGDVPAEKKAWASSFLSLLVGSLMGFLGRGALKSPEK